MQALWNSVKDNVKCGSKVTTAVSLPGKRSTLKENPDKRLIKRFRNSFSHAINKELKIGDPARNITEMIFKRALQNPSKLPTRRITRVLRVKNSTEVLERFERYRDKVKELSHKQQKTHPRSKVDGNELMRFYGTTIADQLIDDPFSLLKAKVERAVIVCRIIAGTAGDRAEEVKGGFEPLVVRDSSAVLPCFVIVFS